MLFDAADRRIARVRPWVEPVLVAGTVGALAVGGIAWLGDWRGVADGCWIAGTVIAIAPNVGRIN